MSHPAEANAWEMPKDTNENKKAFAKQSGSSKTKFERKTAYAENRIGNTDTHKTPTIDTGA